MNSLNCCNSAVSVKPLVSSLLLAICLCTAINARAGTDGTGTSGTDDDVTTAYVDSIHKWGAWELDIEPAAGGVRAASGQPLLARDSRIRLRTNSIAALAPTPPQHDGGRPPTGPAPGPAPGPAVPTITPISPNVPIPSSAPNDGF